MKVIRIGAFVVLLAVATLSCGAVERSADEDSSKDQKSTTLPSTEAASSTDVAPPTTPRAAPPTTPSTAPPTTPSTTPSTAPSTVDTPVRPDVHTVIATWGDPLFGDAYAGACPDDVLTQPVGKWCSSRRSSDAAGVHYWIVKFGAGEPSYEIVVSETPEVVDSRAFGPLGGGPTTSLPTDGAAVLRLLEQHWESGDFDAMAAYVAPDAIETMRKLKRQNYDDRGLAIDVVLPNSFSGCSPGAGRNACSVLVHQQNPTRCCAMIFYVGFEDRAGGTAVATLTFGGDAG